jgi:hypothetical protein
MVSTQTVFLPDLPSISLTHWALSHIGIQAEHAAWWNVETDTSSWAPQNLMHTHTFWILSPGVARKCFTAAIMVWVESPWDSSHLFLIPRIQQRSFVDVKKTCGVHWAVQGYTLGKGTLTYCPFCSVLPPTFCTFPQN